MAQNLVPLKEVVPKGMTPKVARSVLRESERFEPDDNGRWLFPKRTAGRVENYLENYLIEHRH